MHYGHHRHEQTTLYRLVQQQAANFIAHTEASTGADLPSFIKDEFDASLEWGILAYGFTTAPDLLVNQILNTPSLLEKVKLTPEVNLRNRCQRSHSKSATASIRF